MSLTVAHARLGFVALALAVAIPAATADTKKPTKDTKVKVKAGKSVASCTSFDQEDTDDTTVGFKVKNTCAVPVDCVITWRVVCSPESKSHRKAFPGSAKFLVEDQKDGVAEASASKCGAASWTIDSIHWHCLPNND